MMEKQIYSMNDFVEIIAKLRSENGCPWDKEQTHESLRVCMAEEAAEVLAAIRILDKTGNPENLLEELGDVLLQVVMHSQIAKEEGLFTLEDVVQKVSEKMIRRHPHVFGNVQAENSSKVLKNWEEIKKKEKQGKEWVKTPLKDIPPELSALARAQKVLKKTDMLYEKQPQMGETLQSIRTWLKQLEAVLGFEGKATEESMQELPLSEAKKQELSVAISETLWGISNLSRLCLIDAEQVLMNKTEDFIEKYE